MTQHKISLSDITFGEPLPWDLYINSDRLLLRKGHVLISSLQFNRLLEIGLYADMGNEEAAANGHNGTATHAEEKSILRILNDVSKHLDHVLHAIKSEPNAQAEILTLADALISAAERRPDIAVAAILLNQISGTYAVRHCVDTALIALLVAKEMGKDAREIQIITAAALTMNVGMLGHHEQLQSKRTLLSSEETSAIRRHPEESATILKHAGITDQEWMSYVLAHHESDDGSGYPHGRNGEDIPQNAKLISLADRYCAQVSARNYRKSILPNVALNEVFLANDQAADPALVTHFVHLLGSYPPGTYVRLQNGEIGIVTRGGSDRPLVRAIAASDEQPLPVPVERETDKDKFAIQEVLHEDAVGVRCSMRLIWGNQAAL